MFRLIKHFARVALPLRLTAFAVLVAVNLAFSISTAFFNSTALEIVAVSLSACAFMAMIVINILADASIDKSVFKAPQGYALHLFPIKSWKVLLARTLTIVVLDVIGMAVGIVGVLHLCFKLSGDRFYMTEYITGWEMAASLLAFIVLYALVVSAVAFGRTLNSSVFFKNKGRGILALLATIAALYGLSLVNFLAAPFGHVLNYGGLYFIVLTGSLLTGIAAFVLVFGLQCAALLTAASLLMERKINI